MGHTLSLLPEAQVIDMIFRKKKEVIQITERVISETQKLASKQLARLKELRKVSIEQAKEELSQIQFDKLFTQLINQLGLSNQLQELKISKDKINELTKRLDEARKTVYSKNERIQHLKQRINTLKKGLQEIKAEHDKEKTEVGNERIQRLKNRVVDLERNLQISKNQKKQLNQKFNELNQKTESGKERIQELNTKIELLVNDSRRRIIDPEKAQQLMLELDEFDPEKAHCLHQLGFIYYNMKDYANGEQCYLRSMRIRENLVPGSHALGTTYHNLGFLYKSMNNYFKSEDYYLKAIIVMETVIPGSTTLGVTYHNLGNLYKKINNYSKAEAYYIRAVRIQEAIGDPAETTRIN